MQLENVEDVYALTVVQQGMLYHSIAEPGSGVFVEQICCTIRGQLDVHSFKTAWQSICARHAVLRSVFLWDGLDAPLQVVRELVDIPWYELDWTKHSDEIQRRKIEDFLVEDRRQGFDLSVAPLLRMTLLKLNNDEIRFIWTSHHLLTDGWSAQHILKELFMFYVSLVKSESIQLDAPFQFKDYIAYLQGKPTDEAKKYWKEKLKGFDSPTLLTDHSLSMKSGARGSAQQSISLSRELSGQLKEFARDNRLTVNSVVLGVWGFLLSLYSRDEEVVFGVTSSGRPPDLPGVESGVGMFINTLPLRISVNNEYLIEWLQAIQQQQLKLQHYEHSSLVMVQGLSDVTRGVPLFESIVVFENYPDLVENSVKADLKSLGVSIEDVEYLEQSNFPIALLVVPGECFKFYLVHETSKFSSSFVNDILLRLENIVESFVRQPQKLLSQYRLLSDDEQGSLIKCRNTTQSAIDDRKGIHWFIEDQVRNKPDAIAVVFNGQSLTYKELNLRAVQLAEELKRRGICTGDRVGLFAHRSFEMVIGIVGILKASAAYVPLDPEYPPSRLHFVVSDASITLMVVQSELAESFAHFGVQMIDLSADSIINESTEHDKVYSDVLDTDNPAYVIYTSGSQGTPKGVQISHQNLVHSTLARWQFYQESVGRFLLLSSFSFDSSVVGIFWTLVEGGTLVLPPPRMEQDLERLERLISAMKVTHVLCLPSLYSLLLTHSDLTNYDSLRTVIVAGEACSSLVVRRHFELLPTVRLVNEYGPTEATVWCLACELTRYMQAGPIPLGTPIINTEVYVLDRYRRLVPAGVCGELYISGMGLSKGYLNRSDLTQHQFVPNPFNDDSAAVMYRTGDLAYSGKDGLIYFAGRADSQVKIRGYRIEPDEIAMLLEQHESISEAVVGAMSMDRDEHTDLHLSKAQLAERLQAIGPIQANQLLDELLELSDEELDEQLSGQIL